MFLELDYLAGPGGLGVQGVIGDCPAALMEWSRSLRWCVRPDCVPPYSINAAGLSGASVHELHILHRIPLPRHLFGHHVGSASGCAVV